MRTERIFVRRAAFSDLPDIKRTYTYSRDSVLFLPLDFIGDAIKQSHCYVAGVENRVVGFVIYRHNKNESVMRITDLMVHPSFRRKGIGTVLMNAIKAECRRLRLSCLMYQTPAHYNILGFCHAVDMAYQGTSYMPNGNIVNIQSFAHNFEVYLDNITLKN